MIVARTSAEQAVVQRIGHYRPHRTRALPPTCPAGAYGEWSSSLTGLELTRITQLDWCVLTTRWV